jgi:hypothetical protein
MQYFKGTEVLLDWRTSDENDVDEDPGFWLSVQRLHLRDLDNRVAGQASLF